MSDRTTLTADPQQLEGELRCRLDPSRQDRTEWPSFCPDLTYGRHRGPATPDFRPASVVALLYPHGDEWHVPLTLRPTHLNDHAGQVSLPGGAKETGETDEQCALREMDEELGIADDGIRVVGRLSEVYVYASNFLVQPFVAVTNNAPKFLPNPIEVEELLEVPVAHLFDTANYSSHAITRRVVTFGAPSILYRSHHIWGATAMILSELTSFLRRIVESDED